MPRLKDQYNSEVRSALKDRFEIANPMAVPRVRKVVISMGMGDAKDDKTKIEQAMEQLGIIAGQKPIVTRAHRSVSNFKLREGEPVGCKVTLRGARMWEFLDRLISLAIPRVKDFRGLNPSGFDGRGNYNMGLAEQSVFPEIDPANITFVQGMNISIQTSAETDEQAKELLARLGMPFREN
jgi:large subunit ribosomal protein L5